MEVGYGRTCTLEQKAGLEAQLRDLKAAGVEKVFSEQLSSVDAERPQLEAALDFVREGDVLVITKIDRVARSVANLCDIEAKLHAKGASLKVLNPELDTSTPMGRLVFNMVGAIAQFEREIMLGTPARRHRQGEGGRQIQGPCAYRDGQGGRSLDAAQGRHGSNRSCPAARHRPGERLPHH